MIDIIFDVSIIRAVMRKAGRPLKKKVCAVHNEPCVIRMTRQKRNGKIYIINRGVCRKCEVEATQKYRNRLNQVGNEA